MVILLSALAVVAAVILLVAGFVLQGGFALIYGAMGLAVLSMVLLWAARWIGSSPERAGREAPEPLPELGAGDDWLAEDDDDLWLSADAEQPEAAEPVPAGAPDLTAVGATSGATPSTGLPQFPIADYDTLWVSQIVPLVAQLDEDELAVVEARERGGRHRAAVLDAVADARAAGAGVAPAPSSLEPDPAAVVTPPAAPDPDDRGDATDERWAPIAPAPGAAAAAGSDDNAPDGWLDDDRLPVDWTQDDDDEPGGGPEVEAEPDPAPSGQVEVDREAEVEVDSGVGAELAGDLDPEGDGEDDPVPAVEVAPAPEASGHVEVDGEVEVEVEGPDGADDDGWEGIEPDAWDWSAIRGEEPEPVDQEPAAPGAGEPRVRTFLGRRRSPVTVRRD